MNFKKQFKRTQPQYSPPKLAAFLLPDTSQYTLYCFQWNKVVVLLLGTFTIQTNQEYNLNRFNHSQECFFQLTISFFFLKTCQGRMSPFLPMFSHISTHQKYHLRTSNRPFSIISKKHTHLLQTRLTVGMIQLQVLTKRPTWRQSLVLLWKSCDVAG